MSSRVCDPSSRLPSRTSGQQAWTKNVDDDGANQAGSSVGAAAAAASSDVEATIVHRIETSGCGPLLGADSWRPSILALDPKSQQLFVAESGQPRVKVFDGNGKYIRGFSVGGGVESMCVIPGEALVVVVSEQVTKSKMLGLKKEQFRMVNATVKPFLDFKPGFEFNVKSRHSIDKKTLPAKLSIAFDSVGCRFLLADSSTATFRCYSSSNGNFLWEKPQKTKSKDASPQPLKSPASLAVDSNQVVYVCEQSIDQHRPSLNIFDKNAQLMCALGDGADAGDEKLITPSCVVLDESSSLALVADSGRNCVSAFSTAAATSGMSSQAWRFTLLVHGPPLRKQALHLPSTPRIEGPSSLVLNDDGSVWVAYPSIGVVFKAKWNGR